MLNPSSCRKPKPIFIYLYRHNNKPVYVGQTPDIRRRQREHLRDQRKKVPFDTFLREQDPSTIKFDVIGVTLDIPQGSKANSFENDMMDVYGTFRQEGTFNFIRAGVFPNNAHVTDSLRGRKQTPEHIANAAAFRRGSKRTPEQRARMSAAQKGIPHKMLNSPESTAKRSASHRGIRPTPEQIAKRVALRHKRGNYAHTSETKAKISAALMGRKCSPEAIAKTAASRTGKKQNPETVAKRVEKLKGKKRTAEFCEAARQRRLGTKLSAESIAKREATKAANRLQMTENSCPIQ
jgi:GIY-YIG catalytic domain-containing protein/NUMOD3 motif-containing protein